MTKTEIRVHLSSLLRRQEMIVSHLEQMEDQVADLCCEAALVIAAVHRLNDVLGPEEAVKLDWHDWVSEERAAGEQP